jgi:membrane-bound serine protease (ClpP class)
MTRGRALWLGPAAALLLLAPRASGVAASAPAAGRPRVYAAEVEAIIHPVSAEFMIQTMDRADATGAALVVFTLRTPGGMVDSTMKITSRMLASRTPVVVFVGPSGARAASAGFLITIAADVAAMAPGTHFGAAHPVAAGGEQISETVSKKAAQDVAAYARSLATQRRRNVELAEKAVTESRAFTAEEAFNASPPLVDLLATDLDDLLKKLDGRSVRRADGTTVVLETTDAEVERVEMSWRQRVLSAIAHPQIALLLFSLGTLGITIELWNPGAILPGVVGGLCLLLAFFAFQILPINYVGLLLIAFGLLLLVLELKVTSFGLLAVGGLLSMIFGAMILVDSPVPELRLGLPFAASMMLALGTIVLFLTRLAVQAQLRRPTTGTAGMIGQPGTALTPIEPGRVGQVQTFGEIWQATAEEPIRPGDAVRVVAVEGLRLHVTRARSGSEGGGV